MTDFRMPWFPFWVDDFLTSRTVAFLNMEEVGVYLLLLCNEWKDGPLPDDPGFLGRLIRADPNTVRTVLEQCFNNVPEGWVSERLELERDEQQKKHAKRVSAGKASGRARRKPKRRKENEHRSNNARTILEQPEPDTETEAESEEEVTPSAETRISAVETGVENSEPRTSAEGKFSVRLTDSALREEALTGMGLGQYRSVPEVSRVNREVQDLIHTIDRENLLAAMRGFAKLRDDGLVGLTQGKGYTPGILLRWGQGGIWWGEGDQRTQRNFLDLCQEIGRQEDKRPTKRGGAMDTTGDILASLIQGAA